MRGGEDVGNAIAIKVGNSNNRNRVCTAANRFGNRHIQEAGASADGPEHRRFQLRVSVIGIEKGDRA